MAELQRIVVDTNVVVSGLLFPRTDLRRALERAQTQVMLVSEATKLEFVEVMLRPKFDRYIDLEIRKQLAAEYIRACVTVPVHSTVGACRDPKDDKSLELAVDGRADKIITCDLDLLTLSPFRGISLLTPTQYLAED
jgi:putative PIN family toxin of toxin-antitoxin system